METSDTEISPEWRIAGFWRRLIALACDLALLGVVGALLGAVFFDTLASMGIYARLIGFGIALPYFGIFNSRIGDGQTVGKYLLDVCVVDGDGDCLPLHRSLMRYAVLGIPFFANGLPLDSTKATSTLLGYLLALIVFGGMSATIYLYIFNRRTRQSLHDLAVGSYVVRLDLAPRPETFPAVWHGHIVVVALFAVVALSVPVVASRIAQTQVFSGIMPMYQMLSSQPHVMTAQVARSWTSRNGVTSHSLQSSLWLDAPLTDDEAMAKRIAQQMAKADPNIAERDAVVVTLVYGYDMGIASGWKKHQHSFNASELQ